MITVERLKLQEDIIDKLCEHVELSSKQDKTLLKFCEETHMRLKRLEEEHDKLMEWQKAMMSSITNLDDRLKMTLELIEIDKEKK